MLLSCAYKRFLLRLAQFSVALHSFVAVTISCAHVFTSSNQYRTLTYAAKKLFKDFLVALFRTIELCSEIAKAVY